MHAWHSFRSSTSFTRFDDLPTTDEWAAAQKGKATYTRSIIARDRNDPTHYQIIVLFDSYEEAVKNSEFPETAAMSEKMAAALDGPPSYIDLDVVDDRLN